MRNGKSGFSLKQRHRLAALVGCSVPSHHSLISTNQWTSQIVALTLLTKSVSNESVFFSQKTHPHRAFLRNCMRAKSLLRSVKVCFIQSNSSSVSQNLLHTVKVWSFGQSKSVQSPSSITLVYAIYIIRNGVTHWCNKCWKYTFL